MDFSKCTPSLVSLTNTEHMSRLVFDMAGSKIPKLQVSPRKLCLLLSIISCFYSSQEMTTNTVTVEVDEGLKCGSTILTMGNKVGMEYTLHQDPFNTDVMNLFGVSPEGDVKTKVSFDYEDERRNEFNLIIVLREAGKTEGGVVSLVRVKIQDRNDNQPKFPRDLYVASVMENSPVGTYVLGLEDMFVEDPDSGQNSVQVYTIWAGNEAGNFELDSYDLGGLKLLRLKTKENIDREETASFVLTVKVYDVGNPALSSTTQIRINILDENDNAPVFDPSKYSASVNENADIGSFILQVKTHDRDLHGNREVYYFFRPTHDLFTINPYTGIVEVAHALKYRQGKFFELLVVAKDRAGNKSREATGIVQILVVGVSEFPWSWPTDAAVLNPPVFDKKLYFFRVGEDFPVGGAIGRVNARWHDVRSTLRYMVAAKSQDLFSINSKSGAITLINPLDFETKRSHMLKIKAQQEDDRISSFEAEVVNVIITVHIDVEDVEENFFAPVFRHPALLETITDDADGNTVISTVTAHDSDEGSNGKVKYTLTGGTALGKFQINRNGEIRPLIRLTKLLQSLPRLDLIVEAQDNARVPRKARLYLQLQVKKANRNRAVFPSARQEVHVRENSSPGTFVAVVRAEFHKHDTDNFAESMALEYSFPSGGSGEKSKFAIDSTTGKKFYCDVLG